MFRRPILVGACVLAAGVCVWQCSRILVRDLQAAETDRWRMDLGNIASAIDLYQQKHGRFPMTSPSLQPLVEDGELEAIPRDPWGNPYQIAPAAEGLRVVTYGADGKPGGDADDADLSIDVKR